MNSRTAVTLLEVVVVLGLLVSLAGVMIPLCSDQLATASRATTQASLVEVQKAIQLYWHDTKLIELDGIATSAAESDRFNWIWLFRNPVTNDSSTNYNPSQRIGWNGPYLVASNLQSSGPILVDAWNNNLVIQYVNPASSSKDVRIVSPGPNGVIETSSSTATSLLTSDSIGDDLYVAITLR